MMEAVELEWMIAAGNPTFCNGLQYLEQMEKLQLELYYV